jgi:ribosome-associated protein
VRSAVAPFAVDAEPHGQVTPLDADVQMAHPRTAADPLVQLLRRSDHPHALRWQRRDATDRSRPLNDDLVLADGTVIGADELQVSFVRSGGPGGQHVNTSATKVELRFDVAGSRALDDVQKARIRDALASRLTADGVLVLQAGQFRSQARNREAVVGRLGNLLDEALRPRRPRVSTRVPRSQRRKRREAKRRRGERKRLRRPPDVG